MARPYPPKHQILANLAEALCAERLSVVFRLPDILIHETTRKPRSLDDDDMKSRVAIGPRLARVVLTERDDDISITFASRSDLVAGILKGVVAPRQTSGPTGYLWRSEPSHVDAWIDEDTE